MAFKKISIGGICYGDDFSASDKFHNISVNNVNFKD